MSKQKFAPQTNDKFFKTVFQVKQTVVDFIRHLCPPEWAEQINLDELTIDDNNYITGKFAEIFSDVVYRSTLKGGNENVAVTFLLEHKSDPDNLAPLQLLKYMPAIWEDDLKNGRPLTHILPVIFYQGEKPWSKQSLSSCFKNTPKLLEPFIPSFDYWFASVHQTPDDLILALSKDHLLGAYLLMLKKVNDHDYALKHFKDFFRFFQKKPQFTEIMRTFVQYFFQKAPLSDQEVLELSEQDISSPIKNEFMSIYESIIATRKPEWIAEGEAREHALALLKQRTAIARLLIKGVLNIPEIADAMEVPLELVVEIRDELTSQQIALSDEIRAYQLPKE